MKISEFVALRPTGDDELSSLCLYALRFEDNKSKIAGTDCYQVDAVTSLTTRDWSSSCITCFFHWMSLFFICEPAAPKQKQQKNVLNFFIQNKISLMQRLDSWEIKIINSAFFSEAPGLPDFVHLTLTLSSQWACSHYSAEMGQLDPPPTPQPPKPQS